MKDRSISVTEFKAKCLALLDEIGEHGGTITVTRRGKPLAKISPAERRPWPNPEGSLAGKIDLPDDDVFFRDNSDLWECVRESEGRE